VNYYRVKSKLKHGRGLRDLVLCKGNYRDFEIEVDLYEIRICPSEFNEMEVGRGRLS
jgi:hypothetical protein